MVFSFAIVPVVLQLSGGAQRHERPSQEAVLLSVSTDKDVYQVREGIWITATFQNRASVRVSGPFGLNAYSTIYYRRLPEPFAAFERAPNPVTATHLVQAVTVDKDGGTVSDKRWLAFDWGKQTCVLDGPGEYELKVQYRYQELQDPISGTLDSEVTRFRVVPPAGKERLAMADYGVSLSQLTQADIEPSLHGYEGPGIHRLIDEGRIFVEAHSGSAYAEPVRKELQRILAGLVAHGEATTTERALYDYLFERWKAMNHYYGVADPIP
jgi:hypothetical protein